MNYLIILNTVAILYLILQHMIKYYFTFNREVTQYKKTTLGYRLLLWKKVNEHHSKSIWSFSINIRNRRKTEKEEEARNMIAKYSVYQRRQSLHTKFSWLKTWGEVEEFQKYYTCVDRKCVEDLVASFVPRK